MTEFSDTSDDLSFPASWKQPAPRLDEAPDPPELEIHRGMQKPAEVQFVKADTENLTAIVDWIIGNGHHAVISGSDQLTIQTLEGPFTVRPGDIVIRGIQGEFSRQDPELFDKSHDDLGLVEF